MNKYLSLVVLLFFLVCPPIKSFAEGPGSVWIDTDPAIGLSSLSDPDDAYALIYAFNSNLNILGISTVFGNAEQEHTYPIANTLVSEFYDNKVEVHSGAVEKSDVDKETDATKALVETLKKNDGVTIIALGPLTNVAAVLKRHPELKKKIKGITAMAGRSPGDKFIPGDNSLYRFRDLNFELDPEGFETVLSSGVPITLVPYETAHKIWFGRDDLQHFQDSKQKSAKYLAKGSKGWIGEWTDTFGAEKGFNPFDTLIIGQYVNPDLFTCKKKHVAVETDFSDRLPGPLKYLNRKEFLHIIEDGSKGHEVNYCYDVDPQFDEVVVSSLITGEDLTTLSPDCLKILEGKLIELAKIGFKVASKTVPYKNPEKIRRLEE